VSYLLDTNVISELVKPQPHAGVVTWLDGEPEDDLLLSVITLAEIHYGLESMPPGRRRRDLQAWIEDDLVPRFEGRILPIDPAVATSWGGIVARSDKLGRSLSATDGFIAATVSVYNATLVTRNEKHFEGLVPSILNPWTDRLPSP
jgi:toxin FitB